MHFSFACVTGNTFILAIVVTLLRPSAKELKFGKHGYQSSGVFRLTLNMSCRLSTNCGRSDIVVLHRLLSFCPLASFFPKVVDDVLCPIGRLLNGCALELSIG